MKAQKERSRPALRWLLGAGALGFVILQFVPYEQPSGTTWDGPLGLPSALEQSVRDSCYDCHSGSRSLPWYGRVAPLSWWMSDEMRRAQAGLNFSRWPDYSERQKELIWRRSLVRLRGKMMPPPAYHLVHPVLSAQEVDALEKYLQESLDGPLSNWQPDELLAWPAAPWAGAAVTGVMEVAPGSIGKSLVLDGGVLLCRGDLVLDAGLTGRGAIIVEGRLTVKGLQSMVGPVALLGYREVTLESSQGANLTGYVASAGEVRTKNVEIQVRPNFQLQVEGLKEIQLDFCRDDGELGEYAERSMVVRFGWGQYVLWEPELQKVRRATTIEQALDGAEEMLAGDPATSTAIWKSEFRQSWHDRLSRLAKKEEPATFLARPERSVYVPSPPP